MSLINREALIAEYDRVHVGAPGGARKLMVDAPEVVPEIIRCRNCKYYDEVNQPYPQMYCRKHSIDTSDQDFCSRAERRTDESD